MKRIHLFFAASSAALMVASCMQEAEMPAQEEVFPEGEEILIEAYFDDGSATKTVRNAEDGKVYWLSRDLISLYYGSEYQDGAGSRFMSTNTEPALTASFSGSITAITLEGEDSEGGGSTYFWGLYPYSKTNAFDGTAVRATLSNMQRAVPGTFADNLAISMGRSEGLRIPFYNVCSGLKFTLSSSDITKIVFTPGVGDPVAGQFWADFDADGKPRIREMDYTLNEITLTPYGGGTFSPGVDYYIMVLPGVLTGGMKMTFYKGDQVHGTRVWTNPKTFVRSQFMTYTEIDANVEYSVPVDLGLSVKWAPFNVGASKTTEYGDFYAWGEIVPKAEFTAGNYNWVGPASNTLDSKHDAASIQWGGNWRMPTEREWEELIDWHNCEWEYVTNYNHSGLAGYLVTSLKEGYTGNSIFIPLGGYNQGGINERGEKGWYWAATKTGVNPVHTEQSYDNYGEHCATTPAYYGLSVRPVCAVEAEAVLDRETGLSSGEITIRKEDCIELFAKVLPLNTSDKRIEWQIGDTSILVIDDSDDEDGYSWADLRACNEGVATVTAMTSNGKTATWTVTVLPEIALFPNAISDQDDLWGQRFFNRVRSWAGWQSQSDMKSAITSVEFLADTQYTSDSFPGMETEVNNNMNCSGAVCAVLSNIGQGKYSLKFITSAHSFTMSSCKDLFNGFTGLTSITGLQYLDISNVTDMSGMFTACTGLTSLDLGSFVITSSTDIHDLCRNCLKLSDLTLGPGIDFSGKAQTDNVFNLMGSNAGTDAGTIWTTFHCNRSQWNQISQNMLNSSHYAAGRYIWATPVPSSVVVEGEYVKIGPGWELPLKATVYPSYFVNKNVTWASSNPAVATVNSVGKVTGVAPGNATITATTEVGSVVGSYNVKVDNTTVGSASVHEEVIQIPFNLLFVPQLYATAGRESCGWVQLWADGPKFATFNLGATLDSYSEVAENDTQVLGGLYSFGRVDVDTRLWCNPNSTLYRDWEIGDFSVDDPAQTMSARLWGPAWREPAKAEMQGLLSCRWTYCDGTNVTFGGCPTPGYIVRGAVGTQYEDNCIFLPLTGYFNTSASNTIYGQTFHMPAGSGYYWTSTAGATNKAWCLTFYNTNGTKMTQEFLCRHALAVRPVLAE